MPVPDFLIWHCAGCDKPAEGKKKPCNCATNVGVRGGPGATKEQTWWDKPSPSPWRPIDTALTNGNPVLIWNSEGCEIARYYEASEDSSDQPGHDAGWIGTYAFPGRTADDRYASKPQGQPTHWMPLPEPPVFPEDEE